MNNIISKLNQIEYGWTDKFGNIHHLSKKNFFVENYHLQAPNVTENLKIGTEWDQLEYVRFLASQSNIEFLSYVLSYSEKSLYYPLIILKTDKYYWLELTLINQNKSYSFSNLNELLTSAISHFQRIYRIPKPELENLKIYKCPPLIPNSSYQEIINTIERSDVYEYL